MLLSIGAYNARYCCNLFKQVLLKHKWTQTCIYGVANRAEIKLVTGFGRYDAT